ncbi:MAG TPA: hypothetical protein VJB08_07375 [Candidatus Nanoarchaeia archaeon]|nr:hypothetical protein [Candidatus Nanoarchaeia archaeon]
MSNNSSKEIEDLVIARLETLNRNAKVLLMGKPITVAEMLEEVRNRTELGKRIVEVQFRMIQSLSRGEID